MRFALLLAFLALVSPFGARAQEAPRAPITILISIDAFRPDFLDRGITPTLNAVAARGVRADMRPA